MKKLLFTLALIFTLLISCEKEEIEPPHFFIGKWTTPQSYDYFHFEIIDVIGDRAILGDYYVSGKNNSENVLKWYKGFELTYIEFDSYYNIFRYKIDNNWGSYYYEYQGTYVKDKDIFIGFIKLMDGQQILIQDSTNTTRGWKYEKYY